MNQNLQGVGAGKWIVDRIIAKRRAASGGGDMELGEFSVWESSFQEFA